MVGLNLYLRLYSLSLCTKACKYRCKARLMHVCLQALQLQGVTSLPAASPTFGVQDMSPNYSWQCDQKTKILGLSS